MNLDTRSLLRRARRLFDNPLATHSQQRHNRHAWCKAVLLLGDKWLYAKQVQRL